MRRLSKAFGNAGGRLLRKLQGPIASLPLRKLESLQAQLLKVLRLPPQPLRGNPVKGREGRLSPEVRLRKEKWKQQAMWIWKRNASRKDRRRLRHRRGVKGAVRHSLNSDHLTHSITYSIYDGYGDKKKISRNFRLLRNLISRSPQHHIGVRDSKNRRGPVLPISWIRALRNNHHMVMGKKFRSVTSELLTIGGRP
jgi:hypothetical protein